MATVNPFGLPPEDAIKWFREKGFAVTWDWRDAYREDHARAFTVAKVAQLDLLGDIREAVDKALSTGQSFGEFKKQLRPVLQSKGWWGEKEQVDPKTGEVKTVQLGSARRLRIIYDTNLRTAHAAGKWQRITDRAKAFPYLRYIARRDRLENRRPEHQALHNMVRPVDAEIWNTIYPPNGWGCGCSVQQLNQRAVDRLGLEVAPQDPKLEYRNWTNERTGEVKRVPKGISPGFDYNVGKGRGGLSTKDIPVQEPATGFRDFGASSASAMARSPAPSKLQNSGGQFPITESRAREFFREVFGTSSTTQSVPVADPKGFQVDFDERVLPTFIRKGRTRFQHLNHVKDTVADPDEIWLVPRRLNDGSVVIRPRYIKQFDDGSSLSVDHNGTFRLLTPAKLDEQRVGHLHHVRGQA